MKGSDDYSNRRPRPRPSAPPPGASNDLSRGSARNFSKYSDGSRELVNQDQDDQDLDDEDLNNDNFTAPNSRYANTTRRPRPQTNGTPSKTKSKGKSRAEKAAEKKERTKRLRSLLGNQAICLAIIFALVAGFNWMAADYSGEYISQDRALGLVKLSLVREATYVDGELSYNGTTNLEMQQGAQPKEQKVDLTFISANNANAAHTKFSRPGLITRARYIGTIDGSIAEGAIVDAKGSHNVKLTKNIVASLFKQLQHHTPSVQLPRPPKLFQVPDAAPRVPLPNETDSTKPFTYGGSSKSPDSH
ncbi:hypothetical protein KBI23_10235 [bacterium]|nr:hypothetical protein [bacterium]MBP9806722.1 hypothetical protein [bacterium]